MPAAKIPSCQIVTPTTKDVSPSTALPPSLPGLELRNSPRRIVMKVQGIEGMSADRLHFEIQRGGKFVRGGRSRYFYRRSSSGRGVAGRRRRAPWPPRPSWWSARWRYDVIDRRYERRIEHQFGYRHSPAVPAIAEGFAIVLVVLILRRERHSRHRQRRRGVSLSSSDRLQDLITSDPP